MKNSLKSKTLSIITKATITAGLMFLFYRYSDHAPLDIALSKALVFGVLFGLINTVTENWWLRRAKRSNNK